MSVVLISGASRGIGRATASRLARCGHRVFAGVRDLSRLEPFDAPVTVVSLDVDSPESVQAAVRQVVRVAGAIDVLINNAGYGSNGAIEEHSDDEIRAIFETNLFGAIRLSRAVLPLMRARRTGLILAVSSGLGEISLPFSGLYAATKHAMEATFEAMRAEVRPFGVRVVIVQPGYIRTAFSDHVTTARGTGYAPMQAALSAKRDLFTVRGLPVKSVAKAIDRIVASRRPPFRVQVGLDAWAGVRAKRWLPDRLFNAMFDLTLGRAPRVDAMGGGTAQRNGRLSPSPRGTT